MNKPSLAILAMSALLLGLLASAAVAGQPMSFDDRWDNSDNARQADNGEVLYRCGTVERGNQAHFPKEQIDRWIQENRIVAGGVIPVYVHVIHTANEGNVSDADIAQQILVMNRNYAGRDYNGNVVSGAANTGYSFTLAGTNRTRNNKWFRMTPGSGAETQAKNALAINPGGALNIYTCKPGQNLLGWAVFPWTSQAGTSQDGVVLHYGSLPNGYLSPYNLGGTATHEVGHYLGLYHTFQGGCDGGNCSGGGDLVCDTPSQASPTSGCPEGRNSCPEAGLDPIHNYMDYSTDICYTNFSPGQDTRMNAAVTTYRRWIGATRVADPSAVGEPDASSGRGNPFDMGERKADNDELVYRCATDERGPKMHIDQAQIDRLVQENRLTAGGQIPVYFHVITGRNGEGNVSPSALDAQIAVLNNNYAGRNYNGNVVSGAANTGYTFVRAGANWTSNRKWFGMTPGSGAEAQAKNALAVTPGSALNIYICKPGQNLLGWAVFPWTSQAGTNQDGVVIHYGSLPGGYLSPYNLGGTASHEVGHYLGLYHTFQGGCGTSSCSTTGDLVCDTPAEATATSGCPSGKDTCPAAGLDPIHNYMDYSTDICYTNFTPGQDTRMNGVVNTYRSWIGNVRVANAARQIQFPTILSDDPVVFQAKPNPFNPRTKIDFSVRRTGHTSLRVFDIRGRMVATVVDREMPAGNHSVDFDGSRLASGVYQMVLKVAGEPRVVERITLLK